MSVYKRKLLLGILLSFIILLQTIYKQNMNKQSTKLVNNTRFLLILILVCIQAIHGQSQTQLNYYLKLNPDKVENEIDEKIYGFLLEHLYHSVSNGIWGETVWNRSFEEQLAYGNWIVDDNGLLILNALGDEGTFTIGRGVDYEIKLQLRRTKGQGSVSVGIRDQRREHMLTNSIYCLFGDAGNTIHRLEANTGWIWHTPVACVDTVGYQSGRLENEVWYSLNVKVKENRVQVCLDSSLLFDTEISNCPNDGAVTLGGKNCDVEFRNIEIVSLNSSEFKKCLQPIRHWRFVGQGDFSAVKNLPLNQNIAVRIHAKKKMTGIEQFENFSVRVDNELSGSIFLRGNVPTATVRLLDGKNVISEQLIKDISEIWKEYKVALPVKSNCSSATLQILTPSCGDLFIDQVSLMHKSSKDAGGFNPIHLASTGALKPSIIRWPGGSFVEFYDFTKGIGPQYQREGILRWDDFDPLSFGTDEFIAYCRKIGAEPQIVVPIGYHNYDAYNPDKYGKTDWLQKALDWIEYCNGDATTKWGGKRVANGHPEPYNVKYWEIDNEVWKMDLTLYAQLTRIFSQSMKKKDPSIKIIGCGSGRLGKEGVGLDSVMIHTVAEYIDYISPHNYQTINKYGKDGVEEYGRYLDKLASWISQSKNPNMRIYVSEWNLDGIDMRTGLFTGGFLNRLECTSTVEMAAPALFMRHTSAPGWNNAFINFDRNGWFPAPNYVVFKLWRDHYLPLRIELNGVKDELNAIATKSDDDNLICVKMINPTEKVMHVEIEEFPGYRENTFKIVSAASLYDSNTMLKPDRISVQLEKVQKSNNSYCMQLPAFSASIFLLSKNIN